MARLAGRGIAGALLAVLAAPLLLVANAVGFLISACCLAFIRDQERPQPKHERRRLLTEVAEGVRFVAGEPLLRLLVITVALANIGSTIMFAALPASIALNVAAWLLPLPGWLLFGVVILIIGGTFAQYFHGTLHRDDNPAIVRWMRAVGLLMNPQAHQLHHDTLKRDFATNNGWSNPVINRVFSLAVRRKWLTEAGLTPQ